MATTRKTREPAKPRRPPALTPAARENQLISLAVDLAEKQMRDGTASSQVLNHFLKMSSSRERLEQERLAGEVALLQKRTENMDSARNMEELYGKAIDAMRSYSGQPPTKSFDD